MRYISNLKAPDLRPYFKLLDPPIQILGHDAPSDPDFEPECTFWTDDEAAILYHVAKQVGGTWIDVGARFGWTAAHIAAAGCRVIPIDPHFLKTDLYYRFRSNMVSWWNEVLRIDGTPFSATLHSYSSFTRGIVIDGCHDEPAPLNDAITAHAELRDGGAILMHDFWGAPIRRAVTWLMDAGYSCRVYDTPNGVALCWRMAGFVPPDHMPDPAIDWARVRQERCPEFDFGRCA